MAFALIWTEDNFFLDQKCEFWRCPAKIKTFIKKSNSANLYRAKNGNKNVQFILKYLFKHSKKTNLQISVFLKIS